MTMDQPNNVKVFTTAGELTSGTAKFIVELASESIAARGRFVISLSGGHTPERLYALLSTPAYRDEIDWNKTYVFWGDERCVPADDAQNNAHMARTSLLDNVDIPPANIFPVPTELPPFEAAFMYERTIKDFFGNDTPKFDLMLLGLGENGHTASLFPGRAMPEETHLIRAIFIDELNMFRITMTVRLINQSGNIVFLVEGKGKAEILKTILTTSDAPEKLPAQLIKPTNGNLYWYVDQEAAQLLYR